ncbi:MAG: hypothetical protein EBU46_07170 [Nitrosomonadaceae bacterium]|nr:hypothetical protein [Nitrosomonadaceae bacterium]
MEKFSYNVLPPVVDTAAGRKRAKEMQATLTNCYACESISTDPFVTSESGPRSYHNLQHVYAVNQTLLQLYPYIQDMRLFLYIGWFHDCYYNTHSAKGTNEKISGDIAYNMLVKAGLPKCDAQFVQAGITATSEHVFSKVFGPIIDADLWVLAAKAKEYRNYTKQLRKEYRWCSPQQWREGRITWIESMLKREHIYCLGESRAILEDRARKNLLAERLSL